MTKQTNTRSLEWDANLEKYVLVIQNAGPIEHEGKEVGTQVNTIRQVWDKESIELVRSQILDQQKQHLDKLKKVESEINALPKFKDREIDKLKIFRENMKKVADINKLEQLQEAKASGEKMLKKIENDLKELNDAIE